MKPRRSQRRVKGGRERLYGSVIVEIRAAIESLARAHNVSKSFVESTLLADSLGIPLDERYDEAESNRTRGRKGRRKA